MTLRFQLAAVGTVALAFPAAAQTSSDVDLSGPRGTRAAPTTLASSVSPIYGVDFRGDRTFTSIAAGFVASFTDIGVEARPLYGIDFDATATTLYGIDDATLEILTIDTTTGVSTPTGNVATGIVGLSGLTASPNGTDWYVSDFDGTNSILYSGDITTGVFTTVGTIGPGVMIDISMNRDGVLYGFSITDDSLYTIDTTTGEGTVVGPTGIDANFAQGMDCDWANGGLFATFYTGGGTGQFCSVDLTTGAATTLDVTDGLNAEMEIAFQATVPETSRPIYGLNLRGDELFQSRTEDLVGQYTVLATDSRNLYGIDFDASATTLYAIDDATLEVLTYDTATGLPTVVGAATGIDGLSGLTASPDGTSWYVSNFDGVDTILYSGDITTGVFTAVGPIAAGIIIDISMDSRGNLYGFSISDDSLYSIDTSTGAGTVIGPIGINANFAQGMDFDWTDDTLFATVYTGGGTGQFCSIDTTTGVATMLEDTVSLNAEMEMAVQAAVPGVGTTTCDAVPNSTGDAASMTALGSAELAANDLILSCTNMPKYSFAIFIASGTPDLVPMAGGSEGTLCLGGMIGRGVGGRIYSSGSLGSIKALVDWNAIPQPNGPVASMVGDVWYFQTWMRDVTAMGGATSNYSNAISVVVE